MAKKKAAKKPQGTAAIQVIEDSPAPATEAGAAKKPGERGFIAEAIRAAIEDNPKLGVTELQAKLQEKYPKEGFDKKYNMIYSTLKNKGGKKEKAAGKPGRKPGKASAAPSGQSPISAALALVVASGSLQGAKQALEDLAAIKDEASKVPF
jgi:hypothetical protein